MARAFRLVSWLVKAWILLVFAIAAFFIISGLISLDSLYSDGTPPTSTP